MIPKFQLMAWMLPNVHNKNTDNTTDKLQDRIRCERRRLLKSK